MQSRRSSQASPRTRRGFTLIELLVVISIIATLMSLILPAIQQAREAGRRTQCLNNIRNVTLAALNYASANKSRLPALADFPLDDAFVAAGGTATATGRVNGRSFVVDLLPYLDQQGTYDRWNKDFPFDSAPNNGLTNIYIEALVCPNDQTAFQQNGGLTYVANAGFGTNVAAGDVSNDLGAVQHHFIAEPFDWDGDTVVNNYGSTSDDDDSTITKATGVFWPVFESATGADKNQSATIGKIYDGSGNTLMFGENINAPGGSSTTSNWADPRTRACAFLFPLDAASVDTTTLANADSFIQVSGSPAVAAPAFPNQAKSGPDGGAPYLNSGHPGIVVVSMCDGSARTLNEEIDKGVYVKLITPEGSRLRNNSSEESPLGSDF
ncbi:MAG: DUF1559 domain-containing protein [Planctomycetaceae bacterium]